VSVECVSANASKPPLQQERTANQDPGWIPSADFAHSLTDFCNKICQEQTWTLARANRLLRIENLFGDVPLLDCATPLCGSKQPAHRAYRPIRFLVEPQVCHPESCTASAGRLAFIVDPCTEYQQTPSDFKF
jgi:hypothetical protein